MFGHTRTRARARTHTHTLTQDAQVVEKVVCLAGVWHACVDKCAFLIKDAKDAMVSLVR